MRHVRLMVLGLALLTSSGRAAADTFEDRASVAARFDPPQAKPGEVVTWIMRMEVKERFHSYPTKQIDPNVEDVVSTVRKPKFGELVPVGDLTDPNAVPVQHDGHQVLWVQGVGEWKMTFIVHPKATPGKKTVKLRGTLPVCDDVNCLSGEPPAADLTVLEGTPKSVPKEYSAEVEKFPLEDPSAKRLAPPPAPVGASPLSPTPVVTEGKSVEIAPPAATLEEHEANLKGVEAQLAKFEKPTDRGSGGLWGFLATAAFWGAVALITPCVFPMIPITVSFFLHQSEKEHHKPIRMALIYCGTIILVLGISALTLLTFFRALSIHPATNVALGGLFLFFALSLFGLYEITLPSKLTQFTSSREGKGGVAGTVFMALTFTVVSFTCVAPFLGGFGGMAGSGQFNYFELTLGALVFSTTFASPFFVLALFPSLIKKMPQSGSWLNSVKVVMGFLELAAALKFFRTAELRILPTTQYFTYDLVLGIWVALALVAGLYLLNLFRLHHDEPIEHIGVVRMLLGLAFLGLAIYLVPAMFKQSRSENQRPRGVAYAWIDSFLLPEPSEEDMPWSANLKGTIDLARKDLERTSKRQFVLLDCTGVTCTNCKYNERTVFTRPDVRELMLQFRLVQHYTDTVPQSFYPNSADEDRRDDEAKKLNLPFQKRVFGTEQLPLYVAMEVTKDKVIVRKTYEEGKINDVAAFVKFLKDARKDEAK